MTRYYADYADGYTGKLCGDATVRDRRDGYGDKPLAIVRDLPTAIKLADFLNKEPQ